jgi:hypothetical protein
MLSSNFFGIPKKFSRCRCGSDIDVFGMVRRADDEEPITTSSTPFAPLGSYGAAFEQESLFLEMQAKDS